MRKSLLEIQEIDRYLLNRMTIAERLLFQARMIVSTDLKGKVNSQEKVHEIIRWYGRNEKRKQLEELYGFLMADEKFRTKITSIFQ